VNVFGATRFNTNPRQMVVDSAGTTVYAITLSGISVISLTPSSPNTRPAITAGAGGIVNASDGTGTSSPARSLRLAARTWPRRRRPDTIPPPTVLGGSCVTFGDVAVPLLITSTDRSRRRFYKRCGGDAGGGSAVAGDGAG